MSSRTREAHRCARAFTTQREDMAFKPTTTRETAQKNGLKVLVHGQAGVGKTRLCATTGCLDETLIISCEGGLLSLREYDIAVGEVASLADVRDIYSFLHKGAHSFRWVCLDSISEIAEVCLVEEKAKTKDPRAAYGALGDLMMGIVRAFRDLPLNVYFSAKQKEDADGDTGRGLLRPSMPGRTLTDAIPYLFDEVFSFRVERDENGSPVRSLQTRGDGRHLAKDRSGALAPFVAPDLQTIHSTILGESE